MDDKEQKRRFPAGCRIVNIHQRQRGDETFTYGALLGPDGELLISATLAYIVGELAAGVIEPRGLS